MKILTFDIEEWYVYVQLSRYEDIINFNFEGLLDRILTMLDSSGTKATFFCLGEMARTQPEIIRRIAKEGHEIGSHSLKHLWANKLNAQEFYKDTKESIELIEDCIGTKVKSYRAPAFSIGENNKDAFDILLSLGIENDASVFPALRDFGGYPGFPVKNSPSRIILKNGIINEFPISLTTIPFLHKEIGYSGGGYFRILPYQFVKNVIKDSDYCMCYFHLQDCITQKSKILTKEEYESYFKESGTLVNRLKRHYKTNVRRKHTLKYLEKLITTFNFTSISEVAGNADTFPKVYLK